MDSSILAIPRQASNSIDKVGSSVPDKMDPMVDLESGAIHELNQPDSRNTNFCCIYKVPDCLRQVKPKAYTPQQVLIGPLHHSLKHKSKGYIKMEARKETYLDEFAARFERDIEEFKRIIKEEEHKIRKSYSESLPMIDSEEFVKMVLLDSIFIIQFILKTSRRKEDKTGDPLMDEPWLTNAVKRDLILLENQLPYFILEKLAKSALNIRAQDFRALIVKYFGFNGKIRSKSKFSHFTDLFRCVYVETLPIMEKSKHKRKEHVYNADKLNSGGVKFSLNNKKAVEEDLSLHVRFKKGCLKMPCLTVNDKLEMTLRNVMALEQRHYPSSAHVCNYVIFLDRLIDTDKDVDLLVEKGIIKNYIGQNSLVAEMVNKLSQGILDHDSYYNSDIAVKVNDYYRNPIYRFCAALSSDLKNVYFSSLLKGTGTVAAMLLLIMTLIQTVASIIQVMQKAP